MIAINFFQADFRAASQHYQIPLPESWHSHRIDVFEFLLKDNRSGLAGRGSRPWRTIFLGPISSRPVCDFSKSIRRQRARARRRILRPTEVDWKHQLRWATQNSNRILPALIQSIPHCARALRSLLRLLGQARHDHRAAGGRISFAQAEFRQPILDRWAGRSRT